MIVFYVSGHGFGHASRVIEVINALRRRRPALPIAVRTSASPWLFDRTLDSPVELHSTDCDPGVVQHDSLTLDPAATIRRAAAFFATLEARAAREAAWLHSTGVRLVVCDIAPLGCAAAARAGVPAVVLANFTWDWIYEAYAEARQAPGLIATIRRAYGLAAEIWRLPFSDGFQAFPRIVDVPCIARHARRDAREVRSVLALPEQAPVVLVSFGGFGLEALDGMALAGLEGWPVLLTGLRSGDLARRTGGVWHVDEHALYGAGYRYEDLVAAADVVVTKPGFGIIGECAANGTALVYTSRGRFPEYDVLVREMPRYVRCEFISREDLLAGRWAPALRTVLAKPPAPERLDTTGARVVAGLILDRLSP